VANSPNSGYNKNKSRSGMNSNTRAISKMIVDHNHGGLMDGRRNIDDIINGLDHQQHQVPLTSTTRSSSTRSVTSPTSSRFTRMAAEYPLTACT